MCVGGRVVTHCLQWAIVSRFYSLFWFELNGTSDGILDAEIPVCSSYHRWCLQSCCMAGKYITERIPGLLWPFPWPLRWTPASVMSWRSSRNTRVRDEDRSGRSQWVHTGHAQAQGYLVWTSTASQGTHGRVKVTQGRVTGEWNHTYSPQTLTGASSDLLHWASATGLNVNMKDLNTVTFTVWFIFWSCRFIQNRQSFFCVCVCRKTN